jgi:tetratricopeptide (TPR) repeat protein
MSKKKAEHHDSIDNIEHALTRTEQYIENNQKKITYILVGILAVILIWVGYKRLVVAPKEKEAHGQMYVAERYFEQDSFNLALYGDNNYMGFADIADEYSVSGAGNLANYYAGICCLHLGDYEEAIAYLKKFKAKDLIIGSVALGAIGDAYAELDELDMALKYYHKAANRTDNNYSTPLYMFKAAQLHEYLNEPEEALKVYKSIRKEYPMSQQSSVCEKYITKLEALLATQ